MKFTIYLAVFVINKEVGLYLNIPIIVFHFRATKHEIVGSFVSSKWTHIAVNVDSTSSKYQYMSMEL